MDSSTFITIVVTSGTLLSFVLLAMKWKNSICFAQTVGNLKNLGWKELSGGELDQINSSKLFVRVRERAESQKIDFGIASPNGLKYLISLIKKKGSNGNNLNYCERFLLLPTGRHEVEFFREFMSWDILKTPPHLSEADFRSTLKRVKKDIKSLVGILSDANNGQILGILAPKGDLSQSIRILSEVSKIEVKTEFIPELVQLNPLLKCDFD